MLTSQTSIPPVGVKFLVIFWAVHDISRTFWSIKSPMRPPGVGWVKFVWVRMIRRSIRICQIWLQSDGCVEKKGGRQTQAPPPPAHARTHARTHTHTHTHTQGNTAAFYSRYCADRNALMIINQLKWSVGGGIDHLKWSAATVVCSDQMKWSIAGII